MDRTLTGSAGDDTLVGDDRDDLIKGLGGDDIIVGGAGNDTLVGNQGNDRLEGGLGDDRLFGCEDDDVLVGGRGADLLNGGSGNDTLIFVAADNVGGGFDYYDGHNDIDRLVLSLSAAEFARAEAEIEAFLQFIADTTTETGESGGRTTSETGSEGAGQFFFFETLELAVRRVERLRVIVDDEVVIGADPVAVDDADEVAADGVITGRVLDNDLVPEGSTVALLDGPADGMLELAADGSFTYTPGESFVSLAQGVTATQSFTYRVTTPDGDTADATATITVVGVNDAPDAGADIVRTASETAARFTLDLLDGASDPDTGDTLRVENVIVTQVGGDGLDGVGTVDAQGRVLIDPTAYEELTDGETAIITLRFDVVDESGASDARVATITITGEGTNNLPPTITATLSARFDEDGENAGAALATIDLLAGITDPDGDTLTVSGVTLSGALAGDYAFEVVGSELRIATDQAAFQSLAAGDSVFLDIGFDVSDGNGGTVRQTGRIEVVGTNDAPTFSPLERAASEDASAFVIEVAELASVATDIDAGDSVFVVEGSITIKVPDLPMIAEGVSLPRNAELVDGRIVFDLSLYQGLAVGEEAVVEVGYTLSDGTVRVPASASFTVVGANDAPTVAGPLTLETSEGEGTVMFDLLSGADDIDASDVLAVTRVEYAGGPVEGVVVEGRMLVVDREAFSALSEGDTQTITVTYLVSDGNGGRAEQTAILSVAGTGGNQAVDDTAEVEVGGTVSGDVGGNDSVPTGTAFSLVTDVSRGTLTFNDDGTFSFDPGADFRLANDAVDTESFTYQITTPAGDVQTATVTISVTGTNTVPSVSLDLGSLGENEATAISLADVFPDDPDGPDPLTFSNALITDAFGNTPPTSALRLENGRIVYDGAFYDSLNAGEEATFTITLDVSDGLDTAQSSFVLVITGEEDAPTAGPLVELTYADTDTAVDITALVTAGVEDVDAGDEALLQITGFEGTAPDGVSLVGGVLTVDPSVYDDILDAGETRVLTFDVRVDDDVVSSDPGSFAVQSVSITITGTAADTTNTAPEVDAPPSGSFLEDAELSQFSGPSAQVFQLDLLSGATDADGDTLSVVNLVLRDGAGELVDPAEYTLTVDGVLEFATDADRFQPLIDGEFEDFTLSYTVSDGRGGTVEQTASFRVDGVDGAPEMADVTTLLNEDDTTATLLDLRDAVFDEDTPATDLMISNVRYSTTAPVTFNDPVDNGTVVTLDPLDYQRLGDGDSATITVTFDVTDGTTLVTDLTTTVIVTGENDAPEATPIAITLSEDDAVSTFSLFDGVTDVDFGAVLTLSGAVVATGETAGYARSGNAFTVDPAAYASLMAGEAAVFTLVFTVTDEFGASVQQTVEVTINGTGSSANNPPGIFSSEGEFFVGFAEAGGSALTSQAIGTVVTDPDGDAVSFVRLLQPLPDGVTFDAATQTFTVDPDDPAYTALREGEELVIDIVFEVTDGQGGFTDVQGYAVIEGANDAPELEPGVTSDIVRVIDPFDSFVSVNGLSGVSDADAGDVLRIGNISGDPATLEAVFVDEASGQIQFDQFSDVVRALGEGEIGVFTVNFDVIDAFGATLSRTVDFEVTGENDAPTIDAVHAEVFVGVTPDAAQRREVDLLNGVFDIDGNSDEISVQSITISSPSGYDYSAAITLEGAASLVADFTGMDAPPLETVTVFYTVVDANGATAQSSVNFVMVEGTPFGASPEVVGGGSGDIFLTFTEDAVPATIDLFADLFDEDGDALVIESVTGLDTFDVFSNIDRTAGTYTLGEFDDLAEGETAQLVFSVTVGDGTGNRYERDVIIEVTGENDAPAELFTPGPARYTQNDGVVLIDLLDVVFDADDTDMLSVTDVDYDSFTRSVFGDLVDGRYFRIDTSDYVYLRDGVTAASIIEFEVSDGQGGTLTYTQRIEIVGTNDLPVITAPPRFFDNDVEDYQNGDVQNFEIAISDIFEEVDGNVGGSGIGDESFTAVSVVEDPGGAVFPVTISANGFFLVFDPANLDGLLAAGERRDFTVEWEAVTGDGDVITGTFIYRIEGTGDAVAVTPAEPPKAERDPVSEVHDPDARDISDLGTPMVIGEDDGFGVSDVAPMWSFIWSVVEDADITLDGIWL